MSESTNNGHAPAKIDKAVRKENYNFQYFFTEEELKAKSKQLAKSCAELDSIEDELKTVKAQFKSRTEAKQAEVNLLSNHINNGHEWLFKTCVVQYDFDRGRKCYFFEGVLVGEEKMSAADYQLKAELPEYKDGDGKNPWDRTEEANETGLL